MISGRIFMVGFFVMAGSSYVGARPSAGVPAQNTANTIDALAVQIAGKGTSSIERTQALVRWINTTFKWTSTDYEQRTAEQIIERRGATPVPVATKISFSG